MRAVIDADREEAISDIPERIYGSFVEHPGPDHSVARRCHSGRAGAESEKKESKLRQREKA